MPRGRTVRCAVLHRTRASLVQREVAVRRADGGIVMQSKHNKQLVPLAKHLRREMTKWEKHLWYDFLQKYPIRFQRQKPIGDYIVDFYIAEKKIVIEIDGIQHTSPEHKRADEVRDMALARWNITVLRYSNESIRNDFDFVVLDILKNLDLTISDLK